MQTIVLFASILYIVPLDYIPFIGSFGLQGWCYTVAMWMAMLCSGLTIVTNYNWPPVSQGWQACQPYLAQVSQSTEFHFFFYSIIWLNAPPFFAVLLVPGRRALWSVMMFAAKAGEMGGFGPQWEQIKPRWEMIKANEKEILVYSSMVEISLGFYLVAMLIIEQDISRLMSLFIYWSFLRIRFHAPRSKAMHEAAWLRIDAKAAPITALPGVSKVVELGKAQFNKPM